MPGELVAQAISIFSSKTAKYAYLRFQEKQLRCRVTQLPKVELVLVDSSVTP